jgi:hypothetical protein
MMTVIDRLKTHYGVHILHVHSIVTLPPTTNHNNHAVMVLSSSSFLSSLLLLRYSMGQLRTLWFSCRYYDIQETLVQFFFSLLSGGEYFSSSFRCGQSGRPYSRAKQVIYGANVPAT